MKVDGCPDVDVSPATREDVEHVHANLRAGDAREHEVGRENCEDPLSMFESCYAIRYRGEVVAYFAFALFPSWTPLHRQRIVPFLTTTACDRIKLTFVKCSRKLLKFFAGLAPEWVDEFVSFPESFYEGSVKWHERVLGFHRGRTIAANGREYVEFWIRKGELT